MDVIDVTKDIIRIFGNDTTMLLRADKGEKRRTRTRLIISGDLIKTPSIRPNCTRVEQDKQQRASKKDI